MKLIGDLDSVSYHIFPAKRLGNCDYAKIHDESFKFWISQWREAFSKAKPSEGWEDHFHKQDLVTSITIEGRVVASHLYTFYDLRAESTKCSEIFSFVEESTQNHLLDQGKTSLMSMEYLCADSEYRLNSLKLGLGKTILGLGAYLAEEKGLDGAMGTPVFGNKVRKMMENVGGYPLQEKFKKYGFDVDLIFIPTQPCERSRDQAAGEAMKHLWTHRIDYSMEYHAKLAV